MLILSMSYCCVTKFEITAQTGYSSNRKNIITVIYSSILKNVLHLEIYFKQLIYEIQHPPLLGVFWSGTTER